MTHFESTSEGVEQDGKEQEGTTAVETAGVLVEGERDEGVDQRKVPPIAMQLATHHGQVVEDGADDETHGDVSKQLTQSQTGIRLESPEASSQTDFDLFTVRQGVGRFGSAIGDESGVGVRSSVLFLSGPPDRHSPLTCPWTAAHASKPRTARIARRQRDTVGRTHRA